MSAVAIELASAPPAGTIDAGMGAAPAACAFCRRGCRDVLRLILYRGAAICSECLGEGLQLLREAAALHPRCVAGNGHAPPASAPAGIAVDREPERDTANAGITDFRENRQTRSSAAAAPGVTGDMCDMCGNFRLVRTGTCTTCLDCGSTGGCG